MTVRPRPPSGFEREAARRQLVERAVAATSSAEYLELLRSVAAEDWWPVWHELAFRVGVPVVPEYVVHRHAKARALAEENARRRRPAAVETG